jgi:hypothetical protein
VYNAILERLGYNAYCSICLEWSRDGYREFAAQVQGVHGVAQLHDTTPGYAIITQIGVSFCICTILESNSIMKYSGDLVSLGCFGASWIPQSSLLARVRQVLLRRATYFLPRGGDPLSHQGLQVVWKTYSLPTTAVLHQPKIARVHFHFITSLHLRGVC